MIREAHGSIWWTLARDTNCDNIVEVILPEISLAEGLVFVEEVYSSINSLKALNPNRDFTDQNSVLLRDNNNNNSYDDIENDPDMELTIRGSEDKDSRLTETEPQTISIAEEDIIEDENFQTIVINGLITEHFSSINFVNHSGIWGLMTLLPAKNKHVLYLRIKNRLENKI